MLDKMIVGGIFRSEVPPIEKIGLLAIYMNSKIGTDYCDVSEETYAIAGCSKSTFYRAVKRLQGKMYLRYLRAGRYAYRVVLHDTPMCYNAFRKVLTLPIKSMPKLVLLAISLFVNQKTLQTWVNPARVRGLTGMSMKQYKRAINELEAMHLLWVVAGTYVKTTYKINPLTLQKLFASVKKEQAQCQKGIPPVSKSNIASVKKADLVVLQKGVELHIPIDSSWDVLSEHLLTPKDNTKGTLAEQVPTTQNDNYLPLAEVLDTVLGDNNPLAENPVIQGHSMLSKEVVDKYSIKFMEAINQGTTAFADFEKAISNLSDAVKQEIIGVLKKTGINAKTAEETLAKVLKKGMSSKKTGAPLTIDTWKHHYPKAVDCEKMPNIALTGKVLGQFKTLQGYWGGETHTVIKWLLYNWHSATVDLVDMIGSKVAPTVPTIGYILVHANEFYQIYQAGLPKGFEKLVEQTKITPVNKKTDSIGFLSDDDIKDLLKDPEDD